MIGEDDADDDDGDDGDDDDDDHDDGGDEERRVGRGGGYWKGWVQSATNFSFLQPTDQL